MESVARTSGAENHTRKSIMDRIPKLSSEVDTRLDLFDIMKKAVNKVTSTNSSSGRAVRAAHTEISDSG